MSFCSLANLTVGVYAKVSSYLLEVNKKQLIGVLGNLYDYMLVHKNRRYCTFKPTSFFLKNDAHDEKDRNNTAVHLLENDLIDIYAQPSKFEYVSDHIENSKLSGIHEFQVFQMLRQSDQIEKQDLFLFFIQNYLIFIIILIGYFSIFIILLIHYKNLNLKIIISKFFPLGNLTYNQIILLSTKIAVIFLFFNLFFLINLIILSNSMKAETSIINTNEIIDSNEKLDTTKKRFTFLHYELYLFKSAPIDSFLYRLYLKKVLKENNYFDIKLDELTNKEENKKNLNSFFIFSRTAVILGTLINLSPFIEDDHFGFMKSNVYYEILVCNYFRKNLEYDKKIKILKSIDNYLESGIYLKFNLKLNEKLRKSIKSDFKIFANIDDYLNEYSSTAAFKIENYLNIFYSYLCFMILILIVFMLIKNSNKLFTFLRKFD